MRKHLLSLLSLCVAGAALLPSAGCADKPEPPEPIPAAGPVPLNSFVRTWATELRLAEGDAVKELHVRPANVFAYTRGGQVVAMARDSGALRWVAQIRKTDRGGMRPPVVTQERVAIPTTSTLEIFEPTEGGFIRSIPLKFAARSDVVGAGNLVYLGGDFAGAGRVAALDVSQPYVPIAWQLMIPRGGLASTPALFEDVLYVGGGDGNVYAVAAIDREPIWALADGVFKTEGPIVADVAVDETGVYVASTDARLYVLNRNSGKLKWQYYAGRPLTEGPVLSAENVYLPIEGAGMAAFDKTDGDYNRKPLWLAQGLVQVLAEDAALVYLRRGRDNAIVALDKRTGEQKFTSNRRDLAVFATNMNPDGLIFAASKTGRVLAIRPVLKPGVVGEIVWREVPTDGALAAR